MTQTQINSTWVFIDALLFFFISLAHGIILLGLFASLSIFYTIAI
jgi:hypothetical protein